MTQEIKLEKLMTELDKLYPPNLAEEWDQVGLHFGNKSNHVHKVMTSLDIRPEVVEEAISKQIDTIIVHHPVLFKPIQRFDNSTVDLQMYTQIIKHDINIFAMHTNLDKAVGGMNDWLAQALGLADITELEPSEDGETGLGRIGNLPKVLDRQELLQYVKKNLQAPYLKLIEKRPKDSYQRIAIVGGASFDSIHYAVEKEADVFITGDITYHKGHDAYEEDIMTIDAGHYIEHIFKSKMKEIINQICLENNWQIDVRQSEINTNPYLYE